MSMQPIDDYMWGNSGCDRYINKKKKKKKMQEEIKMNYFHDWLEINHSEETELIDETKKWIQAAIKKPGALHGQLGVKPGAKIPKKKVNAAAKKGGKLGKRAKLAQTLSKLRKKKG